METQENHVERNWISLVRIERIVLQSAIQILSLIYNEYARNQ